MGASVSKNSIKTTAKTLTNVMTNIVNNSLSSASSSQIINISNVDGNVIIDNNNFSVNVNVDMNALFQNLNSTDVKQQMSQQLAQDAKAMIKDINIGNVSTALNAIDAYLEETINISTNLSTSCASLANSKIEIQANNISGNVVITNNQFQSFTSVVNDCIQKSLQNSDALNDLQQIISQTASSTTSGISITGLAIFAFVIILGIGLVVLGPEVVPIIAAGKNPKILGFLLILISLIFFAIYYFWTSDELKSTPFSKPLSISCSPVTVLKEQNVSNADEASRVAAAESKCVGYDFISYQKNPSTNQNIELAQKKVILYSSIGKNCILSTDDSNILVERQTFISNSDPQEIKDTVLNGAVWFNTSNATYSTVLNTNARKVSWSTAKKINDQVDKIKSVNGFTPTIINSNIFPSTGWDLTSEPNLLTLTFKSSNNQVVNANGPGYCVSKIEPNVSGILVKTRNKTWAIYTGLGLLVIGILFVIFLKPSQKKEEVDKKSLLFKKKNLLDSSSLKKEEEEIKKDKPSKKMKID